MCLTHIRVRVSQEEKTKRLRSQRIEQMQSGSANAAPEQPHSLRNRSKSALTKYARKKEPGKI